MKLPFSHRVQIGGAAALLLVLGWPGRSRVTTDFVLEPGERAFVRAHSPGWVEAVEVEEGQAVAAGTVVAVLRNPEVVTRAETLARRVEGEEHASAAAQARGDIAHFRQHWQRREQLRVELAEAQSRRDKLVLRASLAGVVTTPRLAEHKGHYLAEGATFCEVADRRTMRARVLVRDWDVEEIAQLMERKEPVEVKLYARALAPLTTFEGRVGAVSPAAAPDLPPGAALSPQRGGVNLYNYFAVELRFLNSEGELREGMTGTAKIYGRRLPLPLRVARGVWRWARRQFW